MGCTTALSALAILAISSLVAASPSPESLQVDRIGRDFDTATATNYTRVCSDIAATLSSSSRVYFPGAPEFLTLSAHSVSSSSQTPACVVVPGSTADVGKTLKSVGQTRTPFAVESGGHALNVGFSSTEGVHISLNSTRSIAYNAASQTVQFGTGLKWEDLYGALEPNGVTVLGARVPDVGVGGFVLGGGYAWQTNQYGLTIDTATAFELVKTNGEVVQVTATSDPDLFWGLKGAGNNFGIVTKITLKTIPQGQVWGGQVTYSDPATHSAVTAATAKFAAQSTNPKAQLYTGYVFSQGTLNLITTLFYDGPTPQGGIFDDFLAIPSAVNTAKSQSYFSFIKSLSPVETPGSQLRGVVRGIAAPAGPGYSLAFLKRIQNITVTVGKQLEAQFQTAYLNILAEPFLTSILTHNTTGSSYPFTRARAYTPFAISTGYLDASKDAAVKQVIDEVAETLYAELAQDGFPQASTDPMYSNYAIWDEPLSTIYGTSLPALKIIKARVDPTDVMGLTGGFKIKA